MRDQKRYLLIFYESAASCRTSTYRVTNVAAALNYFRFYSGTAAGLSRAIIGEGDLHLIQTSVSESVDASRGLIRVLVPRERQLLRIQHSSRTKVTGVGLGTGVASFVRGRWTEIQSDEMAKRASTRSEL